MPFTAITTGCVHFGLVQYLNMVTFFIWKLPMLTCADLIIYSLVLSGLAQLLFNVFFSVNMLLCIMGLVCRLLAGEG